MNTHTVRLVALALLFCTLTFAVYAWLRDTTEYDNQQPAAVSAPQNVPAQTTYAGALRGVPLTLEVVQTPEEQRRGLSGRPILPEGHGMLFVYTRDELYGFWMPDMHFSIDILWLNHKKEVVHIAHRVPKDSYPTVFRPDVPARYVLEVPAGWAEMNGIQKGDVLSVEGLAL